MPNRRSRGDGLGRSRVSFVRQDSQVEGEEDQGKVSPEKEPTTGAEGGVAPDEGSVSCDQNGAGAISKRESEDVHNKKEELTEDGAKSMKNSEDDLERTNAKKDQKRDKTKSKFTWRKKKDKSDSCKKRGNVSLVTLKESPADIETGEDETRFMTKECETASSHATGHESRDATVDTKSKRTRGEKNGKKKKLLPTDILNQEIPSHKQEMREMIESLREIIEDLQMKLKLKDDVISKLNEYIADNPNEKQAEIEVPSREHIANAEEEKEEEDCNRESQKDRSTTSQRKKTKKIV